MNGKHPDPVTVPSTYYTKQQEPLPSWYQCGSKNQSGTPEKHYKWLGQNISFW